MDMSSSNGRLLGENILKRRKRRSPNGGKRIMDGTPNKVVPKKPAILDGAPSKTVPAKPATQLTSTLQAGSGKPKPAKADLAKANPNGGSTLDSAMTVGKALNGMASNMKKRVYWKTL